MNHHPLPSLNPLMDDIPYHQISSNIARQVQYYVVCTEEPGDPLVLPSIPSLIEQLALREEKVMRHQLSTEMLPPATVGYVVNKPPLDPDRVDRPLNRPPVSNNNEVKMSMKSAEEIYS